MLTSYEASAERPLPSRYTQCLSRPGTKNTDIIIGALVLGHSLKDELATHKLAVLVTSDSVSEEALAELRVCKVKTKPLG